MTINCESTVARFSAHLLALGLLGGCTGDLAAEDDPTASADPGETGEVEEALSTGSYGHARFEQASSQPLNQVMPVHSGSWSNTRGGRPTVTRTGTGRYTMTFPGLSLGAGNVQVTGHGFVVGNVETAHRCKVAGWGSSGSDLAVKVACHNLDGTPGSNIFSVAYHLETENTGGRLGAYVWSDQPSTANGVSYIPHTDYQWNSTGATNTITHGSSPGRYLVYLPGQTRTGGNVMVTAFGTDASYCKVAGWAVVSGTKMRVDVRCFDNRGAGIDSRFTLDFSYKLPTRSDLGGYMWANDPASLDYVPNPTYSYNSSSSTPNRAGRLFGTLGSSLYSVRYTGFSVANTVQLVTAYGDNAEYCFTTFSENSVACFSPPEAGNGASVLFSHRALSGAVPSQ